MKVLRRLNIRKISGLLVAVAVVLFGTGVWAENEIHFTNEFGYTFNDVSGPGSDSSSLTEGWRYLNIFGLNGNGTVRTWDYNFNVGVKTTDDKRNDVVTWSLTNLQSRMTNKIHTVTAGDTFESFSQYSLGSAIKGGSYKYFNEQKNSPEITLVYGWAYPRWDNIYGGGETWALGREVYGFKVKQNFHPTFWMGGSYVRGKDIARTRVNTTDYVYDNNLYTFDAEYRPVQGLTLRGEYSISNTNLSPGENQPDKKSSGNAYKIEASGEGGPARMSLEYERVDTEFVTILGSATPDREKAKAKYRHTLSKKTTLNAGLLWFRDNLDGSKAYRSDSYQPEISITYKAPFSRQYASVDLGYKYDRRYGGNTTQSGPDQANNIATLGYRDRFWEIDADMNFGYTFYRAVRTSEQNSKEYTYNISLNSRHTVGDYVLKPTVYAGGVTIHDDLAVNIDQIYEYSAGMGIEIPKWKITSDFKVGQNWLQKGVPDIGTPSDNTAKTFCNLAVYYKPAFIAKYQGMLYVRAMVNDFRFSTQGNNFRENSVTMGVNLQY
jgi:hypothetical protein